MATESNRPAFSAPLYAGLRQGSKELSQILPAFPESVRVVEESNTLGNPTPQMATEQARPADYQEVLAARGREADARGPAGPGLDR